MSFRTACLIVLSVSISAPTFGAEQNENGRNVDEVLTAFHGAAAEADGELYFSLLAENAVYIGTDATERWTIDEFKAFAEPYFAKGRGWTYTATEPVAWFDEILWNESYGTCRGTGVLLLVEGDWRIAQYHLTFPIPNDLSREITTRIKEHTGPAQD